MSIDSGPVPLLHAMQRRRSVLVLVDYQQRLMPTIDAAEAVVAEALFLGNLAQALGVPVFGTEQNPLGLGSNVLAVRALCHETIGKMHFDACRDGLMAALRTVRPEVTQIVIAGCEAHVCLLQTALGLRRAGLEVFAVAIACGSRTPADHVLAMQRLQRAGVALVTPEMVAFEWLDSCEEAAFKPVLALLKQRAAGMTRAEA
jgi:nicotinamidase-related amidase